MEQVVGAVDAVAVALCPFGFEYLHSQVAVLSESVGFAPDQLRYCLSLFAAYPLALVFRLLPVGLKHWFSFVVGVLMAQFVLGSQWIHSLITSTVTYAIVAAAPSAYSPQLVFAFNMSYMSASHLYRIYVDYLGWSLDFTGPQMLLVIKLTSFAYNCYDGTDAKLTTNPTNSQLAKVYASRRSLAISALPSLVEFYGYAYCFTTFLAGPAFEYREYIDAVTCRHFKASAKTTTSCFVSALSKLVLGLGCMAAMATFGSSFNLHTTLHATFPTVFHQWGAIYIALLVTRCKYYFAWKVAEGSTVLSGFGFEGFTKDDHVKGWNAVSNVDILGFEFGQSIRDLSRAWNKGTQAWLQRYVYERMGNSLLATYFVSAIWHGVLRPYVLESKTNKTLYDIVGTLATALTINYLAVAFVSLSWEESVFGWKSLAFVGHIGLVAAYIALSLKLTSIIMPTLLEQYPALSVIYPFEWENKYEFTWENEFCKDTMTHIIALCAVYCVLCLGGREVMKKFSPFGLTSALALWNLGLAVFSTIGSIRTVPFLLNSLFTRGVYHNVCSEAFPHYGRGPVGLWVTLFIFSKIPELVDTMFIVLRKKPLIFLHWYHHITVLMFCWHAYANLSPMGLFFVAMNYTVHAVMYFYYFLAAIGIRAPWAKFVTVIQLTQMVVGVAVSVAGVYYIRSGAPCLLDRENLKWAIIMYSSYFALFLKFFIERYFLKKTTTPVAKKTV
ncbi:hypothetical protein DYB26_000653 [Aphanomyces astaci]|uniref:Uncharacterized protein n=2 Tax=Aphanomyces astaci TaxID=112090 RepID=A0A3R6ZWD4_APHAT|nr:hypothetical protein DYB26_000653 [Aphanomyces astaci]